jgi:hypothetical protein
MAAATRLLDVWIVESNQVYTEVPFTVVADWLQQGRLLAADRVRLAGQQKWHAIDAVPALAPYLPRPEPDAADDEAEAHEPVDLGFGGSKASDEEEEDVDMIPLIDISLVLLIFFMMTATVSSGALSNIATPTAKHQLAALSKDAYWVGIDVKSAGGAVEPGPDGKPLPWYSLGKDNAKLVDPTRAIEDVIAVLEKEMHELPGEMRIRIKAERTLPIEAIKGAALELQGMENRMNRGRESNRRISLIIQGEVSEPSTK